jgi:predicted nucleic acid-binding protein
LTVELLLDNSAWARLSDRSLPAERVEEIAQALEERRIAVCLPFLLEAGYSARNAAEYAELIEELLALPLLSLTSKTERRALDAQGQLARAGRHRLPPVNLMIAAIADRHEIGVLHYDADFELLAAKTDLEFASVWLAPAASL